MRKIHTRRRNMLMLTIMLLIFFLLDNILVSISNYIIDRMQEHLDARTLIVEGDFYYSNPSKPEADAKSLEAYLADESETFSWISKESSAYFSYYESDEEFLFYTYGCDYEALKDYVLTKDCHAPEKNEVIIPKYYTDHENTIDIGSSILSFDELDRDEKTMDGEELVGRTITGTVGVFTAYGEYIQMSQELTVIGVYDNYEMATENRYYINNDTLASWNEEAMELGTYEPEEGVVYLDLYEDYGHLITCATRADLVSLERYIDENYETLSYYCRGSLIEEQSTILQAMMMVGNFVLIFFLINLAINIVYTEEHEAYIRRREYGLMKAVGYENFQLGLFHMRDTIKNIVLAFLATFLIGSVVIFVMNTLMAPLLNILFYTFRIKVLAGVCVIVVLAGLASVGVGSIRGLMQVWKMEAVDALKSEE